jgi:putative endonuclease
MPGKQYYVYIMTTARNTALYTGITNDLICRVYEHKNDIVAGFTRRYKVHKLVYYEVGEDITAVIAREKQIKSWVRKKKLALITSANPDWRDLYDGLIQAE